jgi:hypothetical protein
MAAAFALDHLDVARIGMRARRPADDDPSFGAQTVPKGLPR